MKDMEKKIREQQIEIPESLSPDKMMEKLLSMSEEEKIKRAAGDDIPVVEAGSSEKTAKVVPFKRYLYPTAAAAALFIIVGISLAGRGGMRNKTAEMAATAQMDAASDMVASEDFAKSEMAGEAVASESTEAAYEEAMEMENEESAVADMSEVASDDTVYGGVYEEVYDLLVLQKEQMEEASHYASAGVEDEDDSDISMDQESVSMTAQAQMNTGEVSFRGKMAAAPAAADAEAAGENYSDTNVRTEGVMEGDIVKTDGSYLYVYDESTERIRIYQVKDGKILGQSAKINIDKAITRGHEMFVQGDKLLFVGDAQNAKTDGRETVIEIYDITDKSNPKSLQQLRQDGEYDSARFVDGYLYTFTKMAVSLNDMKKEEPRTYIPTVDGELIGRHRMIVQEKCRQSSYVVVTALDTEQRCFTDQMAVFGGSDLLYVSEDQIFLGDREYDWDSNSYQEQTNLIRLSYEKGQLFGETEGLIPGYLNDDYSLDEKNGHLRLVTTYREGTRDYNALYILDENLQRISVIKNLAEGETIKSARFLGDMAYFVTFRQTDPLFAVDLSDEEEPRVVGYLKIPGFSAYLHPLGNDRLLGIGYDTDQDTWNAPIKLTVFDISDPEKIKEEKTMTLDMITKASVLENRNAFYCDPETGLFGFSGCYELTNSALKNELSLYFMYEYDPYSGFEEQFIQELGEENRLMKITRGVQIGDYFYVVTAGRKIVSYNMKDYMTKVDEYTD